MLDDQVADWADLDNVDDLYWYKKPVHYMALAPRRSEHEWDVTKELSDEQLLSAINVALKAFNLPNTLPVPPTGLPGTTVRKDDEAMRLIREGARYLTAFLGGERKTLINIHKTFRDALWRAECRGHERGVNDYIAKEVEISRRKEANYKEAAVYFIQSGQGPIKIGMAVDVEKRRKSLQTAHPFPLTVLATTTGGGEQEKAYHERFKVHRKEGEWFAPHPDILTEVDRLNAQTTPGATQ